MIKKNKIKLIILSLFIFNNLYSQLESANWIFSYKNRINFQTNLISNSEILNSESSSSISDINGELIFYSDGMKIWNKYNKVVKNGDSLGFYYNGENTSQQGVILLNHKSNDSIYYLFCTDFRGKNGGLVYSIINKSGNNDSGQVIKKKIKLLDRVNESISAVYHSNGKDIWIIAHNYSNFTFNVFLLKKEGIVKCQVLNNIGYNYIISEGNAQSNLKFSPDGKFICQTIELSASELFKFDNYSGRISSDTIILSNGNRITGIEFSPNSKLVYINERDYGIYQYNIKNKSKIKVKSNYDSPLGMQLAPNGKIYLTIENKKHLKVINSPNFLGTSCDIIDSVFLFSYNLLTDFPNFNQSYFYTPSINYSYEMDCINNSIQFEGYDTFGAVTHQWQTKKLYSVNNYTSIGNTKNITHSFADTGTYIVRYIADNGNRKDTVEKTITLYPKIKKDFLGKDTTIAQGSLFNIQLKSPQPSHCQVWYFERLNTQLNKGSTNNIIADSIGKYICKTTNQAFCEVTDTLIINECINNLNMPSIYRNLTDTLFTYQPLADSFVWYKNNQQITITKQPFIKLKDTGTYRVEAAKKGHCNRSSNTFYINKLGVKHYTLNDFNIKVYPNPSTGIINIESEKQYKLKVTDLIGRTILEIENQKQVELVKGVYCFIFDVDGYIITEKVIVL